MPPIRFKNVPLSQYHDHTSHQEPFRHWQKEERGPDDMGHQDSLDRAANALGMDEQGRILVPRPTPIEFLEKLPLIKNLLEAFERSQKEGGDVQNASTAMEANDQDNNPILLLESHFRRTLIEGIKMQLQIARITHDLEASRERESEARAILGRTFEEAQEEAADVIQPGRRETGDHGEKVDKGEIVGEQVAAA
ncbi:hypothetical protein OEA41_005845 [Lepraria neglecta]|uniref:Uncharacterized protein n=1 Tax=Lepraria neglecta TaxID=209136 RepID=A0AAD9ZAK5_9LECA|nr:hypothetical protein OEA41_005845 [Lepraria neglecta]